MKYFYLTLFAFVSFLAQPQSNIEKRKAEVVAEAKRMYESEMASWYGTDLFIAQFTDREKIGGYFSYINENTPTCIFFDRSAEPQVLGSITFNQDFDTKKAAVDLKTRKLSQLETKYLNLRAAALQVIQSDTIFKQYNNTNFNLVPLIGKKENKVYVLTGATKGNVAIYGNDYLITFNPDNKLKRAIRLHKTILPVEYGDPDKEIISVMHSHLPEMDDLMTASDICTTMLYQKMAKWESLQVISPKYVSTWDCKKNELTIISRKEWDKKIEAKP